MTSDEIQRTIDRGNKLGTDGDEEAVKRLPLWEIAYQLAVLNEQNDVPKLKHNPFSEALDSPVGADSEKTVRGGVFGSMLSEARELLFEVVSPPKDWCALSRRICLFLERTAGYQTIQAKTSNSKPSPEPVSTDPSV